MAELFGKRDGCCGGRGGTMHLYDRSVGLFGTNGIVAAGISHAVGAGISAQYARQRRHRRRLLRRWRDQPRRLPRGAEFRRRAAGAGRVRLREQPLRHGHAAQHRRRSTPRSRARRRLRHSRASPSTATTCVAVWTGDARGGRARARRGDGPTLIEAKTYRTVGHHEGDPVIGTYRTQAEVDAWAARCPVATFRQRLVEDFGVPRGELDAIERRDRRRREDAIEFARAFAGARSRHRRPAMSSPSR